MIYLFISTISSVKDASAYAYPSQPSTSFYVHDSWLNSNTAYDQGKNYTNPGSSGDMILDFGRQVYDNSWGVWTTDNTCTFISDYQVSTIVENFMAGYNSNHSQSIRLYVGTNDDSYLSQGNPDWINSGRDWGNLVNSISNSGYCAISGANDIESWAYGSFKTYGSDTYNWCNSYNAQTNKDMLNYGNQCAAIDPSAWSQDNVYQCSYGLPDDYVMPEIYFLVNAQQWVNIYNYNNMTFRGTMSQYGAPLYPGGQNTLLWLTAWEDLNDYIPNGNVCSSATNI